MSKPLTIPGGNEKGTPLAEASDSAINYWAKRVADNLNAGTTRYPDRDKELLAALKAQQAIRAGGTAPAQRQRQEQQQQAAPTRTALAPRAADKYAGTFRDPAAAMDMLRNAAEHTHLITPQTACGELPLGCCLASSLVWIDPATETYGIPWQGSATRGLDKTALAKIAAAAGVDWDPELTCRLDDSSDPYYVHYRAVGRVRNFDGTLRTEKGEVVMDLRDGSVAAQETEERVAAKNAKLREEGKPEEKNTELLLMRKFILRHAESKAMNRMIRRLGVRPSYQRDELKKPFVVIKVMFTGQTDNPELLKMFAERTADAFLGTHGSRALYGRTRVPALANNASQSSPGHAPPPVGASPRGEPQGDGDDGYDDDYGYGDDPELGDGQVVDGDAVPSNAVKVPAQQQELKT